MAKEYAEKDKGSRLQRATEDNNRSEQGAEFSIVDNRTNTIQLERIAQHSDQSEIVARQKQIQKAVNTRVDARDLTFSNVANVRQFILGGSVDEWHEKTVQGGDRKASEKDELEALNKLVENLEVDEKQIKILAQESLKKSDLEGICGYIVASLHEAISKGEEVFEAVSDRIEKGEIGQELASKEETERWINERNEIITTLPTYRQNQTHFKTVLTANAVQGKALGEQKKILEGKENPSQDVKNQLEEVMKRMAKLLNERKTIELTEKEHSKLLRQLEEEMEELGEKLILKHKEAGPHRGLIGGTEIAAQSLIKIPSDGDDLTKSIAKQNLKTNIATFMISIPNPLEIGRYSLIMKGSPGHIIGITVKSDKDIIIYDPNSVSVTVKEGTSFNNALKKILELNLLVINGYESILLKKVA